MSPILQQAIAAALSAECIVAAHARGGQPITYWVDGTAPTFTPTAAYTALIGRLNGVQCDEVIIAAFHGEGGVAEEPAALYRARLEALLGWIVRDTGATSRKCVFGKPWRDDGIDGYGSGGNGDQIRAIFDAIAAAEAPKSVVVETSSFPRADHVHVDADYGYSTNPAVDTLSKRFINAINSLL